MLNRNNSKIVTKFLSARRIDYLAYYQAMVSLEAKIVGVEEILKTIVDKNGAIDLLGTYPLINEFHRGGKRYAQSINKRLQEDVLNREKIKYECHSANQETIFVYKQSLNSVEELKCYKEFLMDLKKMFEIAHEGIVLEAKRQQQQQVDVTLEKPISDRIEVIEKPKNKTHTKVLDCKQIIKMFLREDDISQLIYGRQFNCGNTRAAIFLEKKIEDDTLLKKDLFIKKFEIKSHDEGCMAQAKGIEFVQMGNNSYSIAAIASFFCDLLVKLAPEQAEDNLLKLKKEMISLKINSFPCSQANRNDFQRNNIEKENVKDDLVCELLDKKMQELTKDQQQENFNAMSALLDIKEHMENDDNNDKYNPESHFENDPENNDCLQNNDPFFLDLIPAEQALSQQRLFTDNQWSTTQDLPDQEEIFF